MFKAFLKQYWDIAKIKENKKWLVCAALLFPPILYLLFPTREFYWDGVIFSIDIENVSMNGNFWLLFRPNHLIYNSVGYLFFKMFGEGVKALFLLQILNSLLAGCCILIVYQTLKKVIHSRFYSVSLALFMAFSATWWRFATDANAYIPSILFLLVCYRWLLPTEKPRPLAVGFVFAIAMLFHQLAILFYPASVLLLWKQTRKWSALIGYTAVSFTVTIVLYIALYCCIPGNESFWSWIVTHSAESHFTFSFLQNFMASLQGNRRLFFGGRIGLLQLNAVTVLGIAGLSVAIGLLVKLRKEIGKGFCELWAQMRKFSISDNSALFLWIFCYFAFLLVWLPKNTFYRLFYLPAIILLLAALGHPWKQKFRHSILVALTVLFFWNFTFLIYPYSRPENNKILEFALQHNSSWPQGTTIIYSNYHSSLWTVSYFNPQVHWLGKYRYEDIVKYETDEPLWLEGTAYNLIREHPEGDQWLSSHIDMERSIIYRSKNLTLRFYRISSPR